METGKQYTLEVADATYPNLLKIRVYLEEEYDALSNYSQVKLTRLSLWCGHRYETFTFYGTVKINGVTVLNMPADTSFNCWVPSTGSWADERWGAYPYVSPIIYHNDDGSKSVSVEIDIGGSHRATGFGYACRLTTTINLTAIPRASDVSAPGGVIGAPMNISVLKASESFTQTLKYTFLNVTGTIVEKATESAVSWTPPMDLCRQLPNAVSGSCSIVCETFNGDTLVGTKSAEMTLTVPDDVGLWIQDGWATVAPDQTGTAADGMDCYVQGYSCGRVVFDDSKISTDEAYGATIGEYSIVYRNQEITAPFRTPTLIVSGTEQVVCRVKDSRGRVSSQTLSMEVLPYANPTLTRTDAIRCDEDGTVQEEGTCLSVTAICGFSPLGGRNHCTIRARYRAVGGSYGDYVTLTGDVIDVLWCGLISERMSYEVEISARDALGNTVVYTVMIPTAEVFFHGRNGGKGAAFGKYAETDDLLDVDWNIRGRKNLHIDGNADIEGDLTIGGKTLAEIIAELSDPLRNMPVGYVYLSLDATSPASLFGGTWERIQDRFLLAAGDTYTAGDIGGEAEHTLTVLEMPSHSHRSLLYASGSSTSFWCNDSVYQSAGWFYDRTESAGGDQPHNNMPPYLTVYMWKRVE